jgi:hypothetical protein
MNMRILLSIVALLFAGAALGETNLATTCSLASAEGKTRSACAGETYRFDIVQPGTLVRICRGKQFCTDAERLWARFDSASAVDWIEVCAADKAPAPVSECKGTTATLWGALQMAKPAAVAQALEPADEFPGTFTVLPESGVAPLSVTITWDLSAFTGGSCTASGSWSGAKALKGSQAVTNLTANASYGLSCSRPIPGGGSATLEWIAPTKNTDGSALTNLAGFRIVYGTSATALSQTIQVASAATYTVTNLDAATWFFAVKAYNSAGAESVASNVASKAVGASLQTVAATRSVAVSAPPPPVPQPPVLQVVQEQVFNAVPDYSLLAFKPAKLYGRAALGTPCDESKPIIGSYFPVPLVAVKWAGSSRTKYPVALCSKPAQ